MYRKKLIHIIFANVLLLLIGCTPSSIKNKTQDNTTQVSPDNLTSTDQEEDKYKESNNNEEEISSQNIHSDPLAFTHSMKNGWNLGNTFDAVREGGYTSDEMALESQWCGAVTTREMIHMVKTAGFNTIRIPVSWHNHLVDEQLTISEPWMDRVQEVVDYAIDEGLYVILNIHHDIDTDYYFPDKAHLDSSSQYTKLIWQQIAKRFQDYDEHLIYESINEPRLIGHKYEWWLDMNDPICQESVDCINQLNQVFVNTIRQSTGLNQERYIMVPGYAAAADSALNDAFILPTDTVQNRLIVSVHAYTPYDFALQGPTEKGNSKTWDANTEKGVGEIDRIMEGLAKKFINQGIPVIIGEMGARNKENTQARVSWATYYVDKANEVGIPCCWWDNNAFSGQGENFGLLDRNSLKWVYPEIVECFSR